MRRVLVAGSIVVVLLVCACGAKLSPSSTSSSTPSLAPLGVTASTLPQAEVGLAYHEFPFSIAGGAAPYGFQVVTGALPRGLGFAGDGSLSGTPTEDGTFSPTVEITDSAGNQASAQVSLVVVPMLEVRPISSGPIQVESGCVTACGLFATHSGGLSPLTYILVSGTLPPGTTLGTGTALLGTFTATGTFQFTVKVADVLGANATVSASFKVIPHLYFYWALTTDSTKIDYSASTGHAYDCSQAGSHPDCNGVMPFTAGTGATYQSYTVSYKVVQGDPTTTLRGVGVDVSVNPGTDFPNRVYVVIPVQGPGTGWSGKLLITLYDAAICGPGPNDHCYAQAYIAGGVSDRSGT